MSRDRDLAGFSEALRRSSPPPRSWSWEPQVVRLEPGEFGPFAALCRERGIGLVDPIDRQLAELARVRLPGAPEEERERWAEERAAARGGRPTYGAWVHLPWELAAVHLLDRDEYFEVITNRNREKITREEQELLRSRRVGVVGLSVGGEAAVAVAQEHLCGELVLADFDRLDLSNLNRLNAGFDELGERKTTIVARRIARIDPYLDLTVFEEGVTQGNLDDFLDGLDLLVEESDDLPMKLRIRAEARARGIDIVYAGDERGFLSVEPYSTHPELPPFHGRVEAPQPRREEATDPVAFMRALTEWLGGWEAISDRSRRSLERVGTTLCGYPQLAGEARYAAGQVGHAARRLLLGERLPPFIGHLDLADLLPAASPVPPGSAPDVLAEEGR